MNMAGAWNPCQICQTNDCHKNHKRSECKGKNGEFNPYNDPEKVLKGANSEICEQTNKYISARKHMFNQMDEKAPLMMLRMFQRRNLRLCENHMS